MRIKSAALSLVLLIFTQPVFAGYITLDLSSIVNSDLTTYTGGNLYPSSGPINIGGTPFELTAGPNSNNTWVAGGLVTTAASYTVSNLNIQGAIAMYAIINSAFGSCGTSVGSIGVAGASFSLVEGINVRDHYQGLYCNTQTNAIATQSYGQFNGGDVLFDVYRFDLLGAASPITSLTFTNFGASFLGSPFLAAVTIETVNVDEPGTFLLLGLGLVGLVASRLKVNRNSSSPRRRNLTI